MDSEANLSGIDVRPIQGEVKPAPKDAGTHKASGRIEAIKKDAITLTHSPIISLNMPGMTMDFKLAKPGMVRGFKKGDEVTIDFQKKGMAFTVTGISRKKAAK